MGPRQRVRVRALLPLLCLLALPLAGCEVKPVKVQLPTYFSAGVEELWFWRLDERSQEYVRSGHVRFERISGPPGRKVIEYRMVLPDGTQSVPLTAPVQVRGDSILVEVQFTRWQSPGWFRVSSRNDSGESALSDDEIYL
jgi:hypothetical protein